MEPEWHPEATLDPDSSREKTLADRYSSESTNAPEIGEPEEEPAFAAGGAQLLDKFLHGRVPIHSKTVLFLLVLGWFSFISWMFLQDNDAGKLDALDGMKWFWIKAGIYSIFATIVGLVVIALGKLMPSK
jgi:hypothetical protein